MKIPTDIVDMTIYFLYSLGRVFFIAKEAACKGPTSIWYTNIFTSFSIRPDRNASIALTPRTVLKMVLTPPPNAVLPITTAAVI